MLRISKFTVVILILLLQGCAVGIVKLLGIGEAATAATAASGATSALEIAEAVDLAKSAGDAVAYQKTGKTLTDHFVSRLTGKDCRLVRKIKSEGGYCQIWLPIIDTKDKIKVFQIIENIRPVNGHLGPLTRQAFWNYEHGLKEWDPDIYDQFPKTEEEIKQYQEEHGLNPVGYIGPETTKLLIKLRQDLITQEKTAK